MDGHKNPNDSHNYHDENPDEIEFYQANSNRNSSWHSIPEQRTSQNQSYRVWWGVLGQCTMSHGTYRQVSNIGRILVGNKIVDNSDVVGASPVGAAPTTSELST